MSERQFGLEPEKLPERIEGGAKAKWEQLRAELAAFDPEEPKPLPQVKFVVSDAGPLAPATRMPKSGALVEPGFLSILDPGLANITPPAAALQSTLGATNVSAILRVLLEEARVSQAIPTVVALHAAAEQSPYALGKRPWDI